MNPKIIFGKPFSWVKMRGRSKEASTNRRKRAYAQSSSPFFAARKSFFGELEKRLSNLAEAKGVAVKVKLLRSVWIGPNAPRTSSGYSIDRANLKVSRATQDVHTHALCV